MQKPYKIVQLNNPQGIERLDNLLTILFRNLSEKIFYDRGDPATLDFDETDLTTDETWRDLDLSSIVPNGARAVVLHVSIVDDAADSYLIFRKNGNSNEWNRSRIRTQVANIAFGTDLIVPCDSNRVIEYFGKNLTFTTIIIVVKGWFK